MCRSHCSVSSLVYPSLDSHPLNISDGNYTWRISWITAPKIINKLYIIPRHCANANYVCMDAHMHA